MRLLVLVSVGALIIFSAPAGAYDLSWHSFSGGGGVSGTGGSYTLSGSVHSYQTDLISGLEFDHHGGFWPVAAWEVLRGDFSGNGLVDMEDFSMVAMAWLTNGCSEPYWCKGTDLNWSRQVDILDLTVFMERWLQKSEWFVP